MKDYKNDVLNFAAPDAEYLSGAIQDGAGTTPGSSVNAAQYGDIVQTVLKLIREDAVINGSPNGDADNETNGYELYDALVRRMVTETEELLTTPATLTISSSALDANNTVVSQNFGRYKKVGDTVFATANFRVTPTLQNAGMFVDISPAKSFTDESSGGTYEVPIPAAVHVKAGAKSKGGVSVFSVNSGTALYITSEEGDFLPADDLELYISIAYTLAPTP